MCNIHLDDVTAAIVRQNVHHTPAYWWRGDSDEVNQCINSIYQSIMVLKIHWHKSRPHSAYNSNHTQQYSLENNWCGSARLSHTTPSISLSHHPIYLPPPCLTILCLSSLTPLHRDAPLWIRQLYLNTTAPRSQQTHSAPGVHGVLYCSESCHTRMTSY